MNNILSKEHFLKYKVHRFKIKMENDQSKLEQFLNDLEGEVVSIIPHIKKGSLPQIYGVTAKVDYLMIVEKIFLLALSVAPNNPGLHDNSLQQHTSLPSENSNNTYENFLSSAL